MKKTRPNSSSKGSNFESEPYLYLTTRGRKSGLQREIEIWFTHRGGQFYLIAEFETSHWIENLRVHPQVQVRLRGTRFQARARILSRQTESQLIHTVQQLSRQKYGWGEGPVVELVPQNMLP